MFLHREQSKRQPATLGIYLLQTTLPVIAALNQSQKRLQVWIEQEAGANPRIPTLLRRCSQSLVPGPSGDESQGMPDSPSVRHKHGEHNPRREAVARSRPHGLAFWLAFCFEHKGMISHCFCSTVSEKERACYLLCTWGDRFGIKITCSFSAPLHSCIAFLVKRGPLTWPSDSTETALPKPPTCRGFPTLLPRYCLSS